jgi:Uncharacterised protein family (UPF0164)
MKSVLFSLVLCFCAFRAFAQGVGTTTADILKLNLGDRPAGMAGVYTAMGDDAYAIDYNPAGLALLRSTQLILLHLDSLAQIEYEYITFATPFGIDNTVSANLIFRHTPPINNNNGNPSVNADDLLAQATFAHVFSPAFRAGATVKFLKSDLAGASASAVAVDAGIQLDKLPYGIRAGLSIQNVGTGMTFLTESEPLPMFIRLGIGTHQVIDSDKDLNLGIEIFKPSDQSIKAAFGGEFWVFPQLFAIRAGYKIENFGAIPSDASANVFQYYTLGCTLTRRLDDNDFSVDLAYNPGNFGETVEDTFSFALNFKFNEFRIF